MIVSSTSGGGRCQTAQATAGVTPMNEANEEERVVEELLDACRRNGGKYVLPKGEVGRFNLLRKSLRKGRSVHHGFVNLRQKDAQYKNTLTLGTGGRTYFFEIFTDEEIRFEED